MSARDSSIYGIKEALRQSCKFRIGLNLNPTISEQEHAGRGIDRLVAVIHRMCYWDLKSRAIWYLGTWKVEKGTRSLCFGGPGCNINPLSPYRKGPP
jgi:hypothetical protein